MFATAPTGAANSHTLAPYWAQTLCLVAGRKRKSMAKRSAVAAPVSGLRANQLLALLTKAEQRRIVNGCEAVHLHVGDVLYEPGAVFQHVHFPTESFISVMIPVDTSSILEVGLIGSEGMYGLPVVLGGQTSNLRGLVQGSGHAWRIGAAAFSAEMGRNATLCGILHQYLQVSFWQLAQTAACTRFHLLEHRLARWLLMTQDRAHGDRFHVTHEFLAYMLGVRRVGVTKAASALQQQGFIRYHRGEVIVLDRKGLQSVACSCYRKDCDTYASLLHTGTRARTTRAVLSA